MLASGVRVPASSANLGPGFDVCAAALGLHMELEVEETGRFAVRTDLPIARDRRNLAVRGFAALRPADDVEFTIRSDIPLSGGLGTSAAAYVAGLAAADALNGCGADLLAEARSSRGTRTTSPPPCWAASWSARGAGGAPRAAARAGGHPRRPEAGGADREGARRAAARGADGRRRHNVGRASLLVLGLARGDLDLVARGLDDRLHQPRAPVPAVRAARSGGRGDDLGRRAVGAGLGARWSWSSGRVLLWRCGRHDLRRGAERARGCGRATPSSVAARLDGRGWVGSESWLLPFAARGVEMSFLSSPAAARARLASRSPMRRRTSSASAR